MSSPQKKQSTMKLVCVNPQHINGSNPVIRIQSCPNGNKADMIIFSKEKTCKTLFAPLKTKDAIGSFIHDMYGLISLEKLTKKQQKT